MKKLLVILLAFGFAVTGLFCQAVQAVEDEVMSSIRTDTNAIAHLMVLEEDMIAVSVDEGDEDEGDEDEGDEGDEDEGDEY